ncbi:MAG: hypothetical protein U9O20_00390 [Patescibacteria group bacterium]|nr:hypothetical protein [Patescibacteria group bacterium]
MFVKKRLWLFLVIIFFLLTSGVQARKVLFVGIYGGIDTFILDSGDFFPGAQASGGECSVFGRNERVDKNPCLFPYDEYCGYDSSERPESVAHFMHGLDGAVLFLEEKLNSIGLEYRARIFSGIENVNTALDWLFGNYDAGDFVFISGHSAGAGAALEISRRFGQNNIVHVLGIIDKVSLYSDKISSNVANAYAFYQRECFQLTMTGLNCMLEGESNFPLESPNKTNLQVYKLENIVDAGGGPHSDMDNDPRVWKYLAIVMAKYVSDSVQYISMEDPPDINDFVVLHYSPETGMVRNEIDYEITPDLHITSVKGGLASEDYDDMNHSITETIIPGQCVKTSFVARYINEADQEAKDVDFDWRADSDRSCFDEEDNNLCNENLEDVDAGEKNKKTFNNANLCVSSDGKTLTLTGPDGSISSNFQSDGVDQIANVYVFADVEEKGRDNGDQDISDENSSDEYVKIEVVLSSSLHYRELLTHEQEVAVLTVIEMMVK